MKIPHINHIQVYIYSQNHEVSYKHQISYLIPICQYLKISNFASERVRVSSENTPLKEALTHVTMICLPSVDNYLPAYLLMRELPTCYLNSLTTSASAFFDLLRPLETSLKMSSTYSIICWHCSRLEHSITLSSNCFNTMLGLIS